MSNLIKVYKELESAGLDGLFVSSEENIRYLTGFTGEASRLLITAKKTYLITDGRYTEQAQNECGEEVEVFNWIDDRRYQKATYEYLCKKSGIGRLAFEGSYLCYREFFELQKIESLTMQDSSGIIEQFRLIKTPAEIDNLRKAAEISDASLEQIMSVIKPGVSELDLVAELEYAIKKNGAGNISFETMVLFGERTSLLHGKPGRRKLKPGDIILFDFGALYQGYHADISRVLVCGRATDKQLKIHNLVNQAGLMAMDALQDNVSVDDIDRIVRESLPHDFIQYYYPGMGHGTGLQIHEPPFIKQGGQDQIKAGMVITIEPGLYIPGWGGMRVEDSILIKETGCEPLNKFDRNLISV